MNAKRNIINHKEHGGHRENLYELCGFIKNLRKSA